MPLPLSAIRKGMYALRITGLFGVKNNDAGGRNGSLLSYCRAQFALCKHAYRKVKYFDRRNY